MKTCNAEFGFPNQEVSLIYDLIGRGVRQMLDTQGGCNIGTFGYHTSQNAIRIEMEDGTEFVLSFEMEG